MEAKTEKYLENLSEIRSIMEKSSRFISLSGLSGVFAGMCALCGAGFAFWYISTQSKFPSFGLPVRYVFSLHDELILLSAATLVLIVAIAGAIFFTTRNSKKKGVPVWSKVTFRMLINFSIPLVTGGIIGLILIFKYGFYVLISAITLIFYGLALINASNYTLNETRYLGLFEILLGILALFFPGYGLLFWTIGFGFLHIVYGLLMYYRYER